MAHTRRYHYVGPVQLRDHAATIDAVGVDTHAQLKDWLAKRGHGEILEPFTFVVAVSGTLWLAPRRSEHVALAGGCDVLAAGEMAFASDAAGWHVTLVTNQSTGYCPDPDCWPAVAQALDRVGARHPGDFTSKVVFRRCPRCGERNIVRDNDLICALCDSELPERWNFGSD